MSYRKQPLVLFDFDGTITKRDTLFEIIIFTNGVLGLLRGLFYLSPKFLLYKLGKIPAGLMKENLIAYFFKGVSFKNWKILCDEFSNKRIPSILKKKAIQRLLEYKDANYRIIIVSASIEDWVAPWCIGMGLEYLCTRLEFKNELLTGRLMGPNCNGPEKVRRIENYLKLETYYPIYAYGDSKGDFDMLSLADHAFYKPF